MEEMRHIESFVRCPVFPDELSYLTEIDEEVRDIDQSRRCVGAESRDLDTTSLVCHRVKGIDEVLITRHENRSVVSTGETEHVHCNLYVKIRLPSSIVKSLEFFLDDAKSVTTHPKKKTLLPLCSGVDARVEESAKQSSITEQNLQQFVVIDVYVVEARGMEEIIAINEDGDSSAMPELP